MGEQFVVGRTIEAALKRSQREGWLCSFDMLGEGARTDADAERYEVVYARAIEAVGKVRREAPGMRGPQTGHGVSVKLSALSPRYEATHEDDVWATLYPRILRLAQIAAKYDINYTMDAEEADRLTLSLKLLDRLAHEPSLGGWTGLGLAVQAYQKRGLETIERVADLARRSGRRLMVRLVKGAYWDSEIKRAQVDGLADYPVYTRKAHTDVSYLACARKLLGAPEAIYPQFATHNAGTIAAILQMGSRQAVPFELQRLHGMGEGIYREVLKNPLVSCRVYAPVGAHRDLLAYLVRRLLENGANSSFVHQLADESVGMDELLISPLRLEPQPSLPLPADLYGAKRANSQGLDLAVATMREPLLAELSYLAMELGLDVLVEAVGALPAS